MDPHDISERESWFQDFSGRNYCDVFRTGDEVTFSIFSSMGKGVVYDACDGDVLIESGSGVFLRAAQQVERA